VFLQVYYLYRLPIHAQSTLPTWVGAFRLLRLICLRERITLVHCHQAFSTLGGEALLQARTMGYKVSSSTITPGAEVQQMCLGKGIFHVTRTEQFLVERMC
jgi:hypothetical protein